MHLYGSSLGGNSLTAGYIANAEIDEIAARNPNAQILYDAASDRDIMVYDDIQWVAYMSNATKSVRIDLYQQSFQMGGVSNWAVDLEAFLEPPPRRFRATRARRPRRVPLQTLSPSTAP